MALVGGLVLILLVGFGLIAWVMITEKKKESPRPTLSQITQPQLSPQELLGRVGIETPKPANPTTLTPPKVEASAKAESDLSLKYDELLAEHTELKAQHARLESLFTEKSTGLEKTEKNLNNELKTQKEFNKVKDVLEKELKDSKERMRVLQGDVTTAQTETQTQLKRVTQLEEKVKKLELDVLTSEAAINDAQALTQIARKHSGELEEKVRGLENQILEKNKKIEDIVGKMNIPNVFPGNSLGASDHVVNTSTDLHFGPEPAAGEETPNIPGASSVSIPALPPADNVVEKGGGEESPLLVPEGAPEPAPEPVREDVPEKSTEEETLTLLPDILAKPAEPNPEPATPDPLPEPPTEPTEPPESLNPEEKPPQNPS